MCRRPDRVGDWQVRSVTFFERAFGVTEADDGYSVLPFRLGELLPVDGPPTVRRFLTYSHTSLAMCGAVKQGTALLLGWKSPEVRLDVTTEWPDHPMIPGRMMNGLTMVLGHGADEFTVRPVVLGQPQGEYYEVVSGLSEGEEIAVAGVFLLKSALVKSEGGED